MFLRSPFRSLMRAQFRHPISQSIPRTFPRPHFLPIASPRNQTIKPPSIRAYAQYGRPPPHRQRQWGNVSHEELEEELRNAKPFIAPGRLKAFASSPGFYTGVVVVVVGVGVFYYTNLEEVPVSGRRRFNCFSDEYIEGEGEMAYKMIMHENQGNLLPDWDPRTRQVRRVMERLIPASGVQGVAWEVHVIDSSERNAFVIPGGKVFVYTGILKMTQNDDGLAAVLGHEIAHNVARHAAESMSSMIWLMPARYLFYFLDATGYTLGLGRVLGDLLLQFGIQMPASRKQESEADYIGLIMMAKSCYDPSEAARVWQRMEAAEKGNDVPQWLSTHPSNANRISQMQKWLQAAEDARQDSGCAVSLSQSRAFQDAVGSWAIGDWS